MKSGSFDRLYLHCYPHGRLNSVVKSLSFQEVFNNSSSADTEMRLKKCFVNKLDQFQLFFIPEATSSWQIPGQLSSVRTQWYTFKIKKEKHPETHDQ